MGNFSSVNAKREFMAVAKAAAVLFIIRKMIIRVLLYAVKHGGWATIGHFMGVGVFYGLELLIVSKAITSIRQVIKRGNQLRNELKNQNSNKYDWSFRVRK